MPEKEQNVSHLIKSTSAYYFCISASKQQTQNSMQLGNSFKACSELAIHLKNKN